MKRIALIGILFLAGCAHGKIKPPFDSFRDRGYQRLTNTQAALNGVVLPKDPPSWFEQYKAAVDSYNRAQGFWTDYLMAKRLHISGTPIHRDFVWALRVAERDFAALQHVRGVHP